MKSLLIVFAALMFVGNAKANDCAKFESVHACVNVEFESVPVIGQASAFILSLTDIESGEPVVLADGQTLFVDLWMPMHGHGSRPVTLNYLDDVKVYEVTDAYFLMAGHWEIRAFVLDAEGNELDKAINAVHLNGGHGGHHH
ncbi:MAG: FixH family protein [Bdellovibrionales bacterium]|nr:FixH family protein [Bdellovibrionales bacterium]